MPKKINLGNCYLEMLECLGTLNPADFQQKISTYSLERATLGNWIKANDFQFIYQAIEAKNFNLAMHLFNQTQILSKKILSLRDYEFLRMSIAQTNPQIFDFLVKHLSKSEQQQFLLKHGMSLFNKAIAQNLPYLIIRLLELDPNEFQRYLNHDTDKYLLQIAAHNQIEILNLLLEHMSEDARLHHLQSQQCHFLKSAIVLNHNELIKLVFRYQPNLLLELDNNSRIEMLAFIAYFSSKKCFEEMVYFIQPDLIKSISQLITEPFLNEVDIEKQGHIFDFLIQASPNLVTFLKIYNALKNNQHPVAQKVSQTYKPLLQVYEFLEGLVVNRACIPEEVELFTAFYPYVSIHKKLEMIESFLLDPNLNLISLFRFKNTLINIGNRKIEQLEQDENHHIHPFFPALVNYYLPIMQKLHHSGPEKSGFLLNFSIQLIERLELIKPEDLKQFPQSSKGFYCYFISQLIQSKNHIIYKSPSVDNKALHLLFLLKLCQQQQVNCMQILSHAINDISIDYQRKNSRQTSLRIQPHDWIDIFKHIKPFLIKIADENVTYQSRLGLS